MSNISGHNGTGVTFTQRIPLDRLVIGADYQRPMNWTKVKSIARAFDPYSVGVLAVVPLGNGFYQVLDGQHRTEAMRMVGTVSALCEILPGMAVAKEAATFTTRNNGVTKLSPRDGFNAKVQQGDSGALAIIEVASTLGLTVVLNGSVKSGQIRPTAGLYEIYNKGGRNLVYRVLSWSSEAWGPCAGCFDTNILYGITQVISHHGGTMSKEDFVAALSNHTPQEVHNIARPLYATKQYGLWTAYERALITLYNVHHRGAKRI